MWEPGESDITTSVVKVNLTEKSGTPIVAISPFEIAFKNTGDLVWQNMSTNFSLISNTSIMFYHAVNASERDAKGGVLVLDVSIQKASSIPEIYFNAGVYDSKYDKLLS